jgi:hypothetical protein
VAVPCLVVLAGLAASSVPILARSGERGAARKKANAKAASEPILHAQRPAARMQGAAGEDEPSPSVWDGRSRAPEGARAPREHRMRRSRSWNGDLRSLPQREPRRRERPEREGPEPAPMIAPGTATEEVEAPSDAAVSAVSAPAPATGANFDGLDFANWGAGHPPDTNGDVGPAYYIQTINTSIGIYSKSDGTRVAAFVFDDLMKQGNFGNACDTENFGDPVVLYDTFEDRWVITDFAFRLLAGAVVPPALQCFAVSKSGDPVSGAGTSIPSRRWAGSATIRSSASGRTGSTCPRTCSTTPPAARSRTRACGR